MDCDTIRRYNLSEYHEAIPCVPKVMQNAMLAAFDSNQRIICAAG